MRFNRKEFPLEFNLRIYHDSNPDLHYLPKHELKSHWQSNGKNEGRVASEIFSRNQFIKLIPTKKNILEIGQLHNPIVKTAKNLDVFTKDELISKYKNDPNVDVSKITDVHFLVKENKWDIYNEFECIVSSHNIEHSPCLVHFLKNVEEALTDNGVCFLVIPDFRYCFDRFRFPSGIIDVLDAWFHNKSQPAFKEILENALLTTHNNPVDHWKDPYNPNLETQLNLDPEKIKNLLNIDFNKYHDVHCWKFYPDGFEKIINYLNHLNLTKLKLERLYPTLKNSFEFFAILRKS